MIPISPSTRNLSIRLAEASLNVQRTDAADDQSPVPEEDYREISFERMLELDFRNSSLIIDPTYFCNLRCLFCSLPITEREAVEIDHLRVIFQTAYLLGTRTAVVSGGEPGIYPEIRRLTAMLDSIGYRVVMLTHGLWAQDIGTARSLVEAGISDLLVSLKGMDEPSSTALSGKPGIHTRQVRAIRNLASLVSNGTLKRLRINHVIGGETLGMIHRLEWLASLDHVPEVVFSLLEPYTPEMTSLLPSPAALRSELPLQLRRLADHGIPFTFEGVPLCYAGAFERMSGDIRRQSDESLRMFIKPRDGTDYVLFYHGYQRLLQFIKPAGCDSCGLRNECPGLHKKSLADWPVHPVAATGDLAFPTD